MATIFGTSKGDRLGWWQSAEGNFILGLDGNDTLEGSGQTDTLSGGSGDDHIWNPGGSGDMLLGGSGNDTIVMTSATDVTIDGGSGIDRVWLDLRGSSGIDFVFDASSAMVLASSTILNAEWFGVYFSDGNDAIAGGYLNDFFDAGDGNDTVYGLNGDDSLDGGSGDDVLFGGAGNDSIHASGGDDIVAGGDGNDWITDKGPGDNVIDAGRGHDYVQISGAASSAKNIVKLGDGNDELLFTDKGLATLNADGGAGIDCATINVWDYTDNLTYTVGALAYLVTIGGYLKNFEAVSLYGGLGNDSLTGGAYGDRFFAGEGNDTLNGLAGDDELIGGGGADLIMGGDGNDTIGATNHIDHDGLADTVNGGAGDDSVVGISNGDTAIGGDGIDSIAINMNGSAGVSFVLTDGLVHVDATTAISGFERIVFIGTSGNDSVVAGNLNDELFGGSGDNILIGRGGDDIIADYSGQDTLIGGAGNDTISTALFDTEPRSISGGAGSDTLVLDSQNAVNLDLRLADGGLSGWSISGIENVSARQDFWFDFNNVIKGNGAANRFFSAWGDDLLCGRGGDDVLAGGGGEDTLAGGLGQDVFVYEAKYDSWDIITDFTSGEDKIQFTATGPFQVVNGIDPQAATAELTFLFDQATHELWLDMDGIGGSHAFVLARLNGVTSLSQDDFLLSLST